ncbi:MAG: mechanosensitive ion channel family protein [Ruminococcaceae bacterium]|nr:mechanosensitive ion channel family protein [Oscillospiraceae bacterium]
MPEFNITETLMNFLFDTVVPYLWRIIGALLVLAIGFKLVNVIVNKITKSKGYEKMDTNVQSFLNSVLRIVLKVIIVIVAVSIVGIPTASLIAGLTTCGAAIALAVQGGLSNIAAGIVILLCKPFHIGDFIVAAGVSGVVKEIGLYYTSVTTPDNQDVVIPNGSLSNCTITNLSTCATRRIDFDFSVDYKSDIALVRKVLLATAANNENVMQDPAPEVMISGHGASGIDVKLRLWVSAENYWTVYFAMYEDVKKSFDQFNIEIPYQQIDVHMDSAE